MSIIKRIVEVTEEVVVGFKCDRCGKEYIQTEQYDDNTFEIEERHEIRFVGGYGSVFGDCSEVNGVFCQRCLNETLGKYLYIDGVRDEDRG